MAELLDGPAPGGVATGGALALAPAPLLGGPQGFCLSEAELEARARMEYVRIKWTILQQQKQAVQREWREACEQLARARGQGAEEGGWGRAVCMRG